MGKHAKAEEIVAKLRQFEALTAQGEVDCGGGTLDWGVVGGLTTAA